ncbi:MAG: Ig-like domain-containing protein, partial [Clostridia bacterium]|nr:Ig-like domain-containing protein [Clostridia bacterium]
MKKVLAALLTMIMVLCSFSFPAAAEAVKDGFTLVPTLYGRTGVAVSSTFVLTTPDAMSPGELTAALSLDGQPAPKITQTGDCQFTVTPSAALSHNTLYLFRLKRFGKTDITWAFQTAVRFQVVSGFPGEYATNVPVNCGIEITFSGEGFSDIAEHFSIAPHVNGRFETHKNTAVFVPGKLAYQTLYTVTLKAGVKLLDTGETLNEDYVFSFETEPAPGYEWPERGRTFRFFERYTELPTIEPPVLGFRIDTVQSSILPFLRVMPNPVVSVYRFTDTEQAVEAVRSMTGAPTWSRYAREDYLADTQDMAEILSFSAKDGYDERGVLTLPDTLSPGFYLIEAATEKFRDQMVVQISNIPVQVISADNQTLVWANDIISGGALAGAVVYDGPKDKTYYTDENGVAVIDRALEADKSEWLVITAADGRTCVWLFTQNYWYGKYGWYGRYDNEAYWTVLQLDRTLFKRDDTVSFFGFAQPRGQKEALDNVTVVLTQGYYYAYDRVYGARDILHQQVVPVQNSAYAGEIQLPNLDTGSYCLSVTEGETVLGSIYFAVQDYVKPPYKMEVNADKKAVFADDTVTFTAKAGFFEGTPVSDLDISYRLWSYDLVTSGNGRARSNLDGEIKVSQKIIPTSNAQGEQYLTFMAEATLPEMGNTTQYAHVRAFVNDMEVQTQASRKGKDATLTVDVHTITLDRLNDGTAEDYMDYLDAPVSGKNLAAEVYRVCYEKVLIGEYYDFIEKKNLPRYRYERREEKLQSLVLETDENGSATVDFTVPGRDFESYYAYVTCLDGNGRSITEHTYIGRDYSDYYYYADSNEYFLDGAEAGYSVGDAINLTLKRGTDTVTDGNFLFVMMRQGIISYRAGANPYADVFTRECIPNVTINAVYFNGYTYQSGNYYMNAYIGYNYDDNDLVITAATDKETYKPGDTCVITIAAADKDGNAKEANVNISVVDEALFALRDYQVNTLASLYRHLSNGLRFSVSTHITFVPDLLRATADDLVDAEMAMSTDAPASGMGNEMGGGEDTYIREIFKDTAIFGLLRTDAQGMAEYTFQLPDNITSWRLTVSGVSQDLYAGSGTQNIIVTNPMFLSYTLNDTFLTGDKPFIGVNAYGTSLTGGETVLFEVWNEEAPDTVYSASGIAFERVNIPLWEMTAEGAGALVVKATVSNGLSDAVRHPYQVLSTYRQTDTAVYYDVTTDTVFETGTGGLTQITFTDKGRGQFLRQLIGLRYGSSDRVEKRLVRREANQLLAQYFPDLTLYNGKETFNPQEYQRYNGGLAILTYADSDLETTLKLMPYVLDEINAGTLKKYLYDMYEGDNAANKMGALYGLAMLKEPVLLDLEAYSLQDTLTVKDAVYIALGYCALGEVQAAETLYDNRIAPNLEAVTPYWRVNTGVDQDDILEATSAAALLAAALQKPEREGLYRYLTINHTTDVLIDLETL